MSQPTPTNSPNTHWVSHSQFTSDKCMGGLGADPAGWELLLSSVQIWVMWSQIIHACDQLGENQSFHDPYLHVQ